jgi:hypothetical protein
MAATQNDFKVLTNLVVRGTATIATVDSFVTTGTSAPLLLPSLNLNFVASNTLDPRVSFVRASGATYVGKDGLIQYARVNQPRLDFDPVNTGTCLGLLIEEPRTNIHFYSAQAGLTVSNGNCKFTTATVIAPDGSLADIVTNTPSVNSYFYNQSNSIMTPLTYYTRSVYAKTYGGSNTIIFENYINGGNTNCQFNLATGAISNNSTGTAYMVNAGNGWYRCIWTVQSSASASDYSKVTYIGGYGTTPLTTPIAVWGSQLEAGGFATSYIPTVASQVTRINDWAYINGQNFSNWYNQTAGTFYIDSDGTFSTSTYNYPRVLHVGDGSVQTNVLQYLYNLGPNNISQLSFTDWANNNYIQGISGPTNLVSGTRYKSAFTYSASQLTGYISGSSFQTGTVTILSYANQMGIGGYSFFTNNSQINGHIKQVTYWPTVLPQGQLQILTTATVFTSTNFVNTVLATNARTPDFQVDNGILTSANLEVSDIDKLYATTLQRPTQQPSLMLNFLRGTLDSRINFSRASGATVVRANGLIQYVGNNVPRFDYSTTSTGTCLGLLIEDARTNIYTNSQNFTATVSWSVPSCPYKLNGITAPDGSQTGFLLTSIPNVASSFGSGNYSYVFTSTYTRSVYAKAISGVGSLWWQISPNQVNYYAPQYDLINGVVVSNNTGTASIVNVGNGWFRCIHTFNTTGVVPVGDSWFIGGYGSGPTTSTVALWGAQMEQGTFATSYIPTGNSSVTRAVDLATISGQNFNNFINLNQGTLSVEADSMTASADVTGSYRWAASLSAGYGQKIGIYKIQSYNGLLPKMADDAYVSKFEPLIGYLSTNTIFKAAISYSSGNQYAAFNYTSTASGTASSIPKVIDNLRIGNGDACWCGHLRKIVYYPEQLSNIQTQALTVI